MPGYDPMPPRRYRELYRREAAKQAAISGYDISIHAKPAQGGPYRWYVTADMDGQHVDTTVEFLLWNDIVQDSMQASILASYWLMLRTFWLYLGSGALLALIRLRAVPMLAALYPVAMLLGQLLLAMLLGWGVSVLMGMVLPAWLGWLAAVGVVAAVLIAFKRHDARLYAYYLLYDYAYSAWNAAAHPPAMRQRLNSFKASIRAALDDDNDEVLIVGHSSGAHLAIEILAEMEREGMVGADETRLSLLTLGHVVPMVSYLPAAKMLRRNLHDFGASDTVAWVDVSAPNDGACFALCDPVATSGMGDGRPLILSAAFSLTMAPERYAKEKNRFFDQHFQYLCAFERSRSYEYFRITAGPLSLRTRFAEQAHSPSRRVRCTSKYLDMETI